MAEVPLPAALVGKSLGKAGQVGHPLGGDVLGLHHFTVMGKEGVAQGLHHLLMIQTRQQLAKVRHPASHRADALGRQLLGVGIEVVDEAAEIGIQQQGTVVKAAIMGLPVGRTRHLAIPVRGRHQQVVAPGGKSAHAESGEGIDDDGGGDALVITGLARHEGETAVAKVVEHGAAPAAAPGQGHPVLFHAAGVALLPGVLGPAYHHGYDVGFHSFTIGAIGTKKPLISVA